MPPVKELHYFDHLFVPENRSWTRSHIERGVDRAIRWHMEQKRIDRSYLTYLIALADSDIFTEQWYRKAFDRPGSKGKIIGDITPEYCMVPAAGVNYVRRLLGPVKVIYIIREPVERALSQIRMYLNRRSITSPTAQDWETFLENHDVFTRGDYERYIPQWRNAFADDDTLFLPFQQLVSDPAGFLHLVERFLGVEPISREAEKLREPVHASPPSEPPAHVRSAFEYKLRSQRKFLQSEFGQGFTS